MAAPSYTTDLTLLTDADGGGGDPGTWAELTGYTGGSNLTSPDTDYYIQGTGCTTLATAGKTGLSVGIDYSHTTTFSFNSGECIFIWAVLLAGNAMDTFDNGGIRLGIGPSNGNAYLWKAGGSDYGRNPYGGWANTAIDPTYPADYTIGTPTTTYQDVCILPNLVNAISKGNLLALDTIRYGRGELLITEGEIGNPATFSGMASANDDQNARWGLFQYQAGIYLWKGLLSFGDSATLTPVYFVDQNKTIAIDDTPRTNSSFNRIEFNDSTSYISWTGITIYAVNSNGLSVGDLEVLSDCSILFDTCTFTDMGNFTFDSTATSQIIDTTTFRRCRTVYQGLATFNGCVFEESDSTAGVALYVSDLGNITNCDFFSAGTGHGIELDSNHAGGSYDLIGCSFTNYASIDGSTGDEALYNNSGGHVTIYIKDGEIPSVRNGTGSTTTIIQAVDWYFRIENQEGNLVTTAEFRIYDINGSQLYGVETSDGTETYTFEGALSGTPARIVVLSLDYLYYTQTLNHPNTSNTAGTPIVITLFTDRVYENPA